MIKNILKKFTRKKIFQHNDIIIEKADIVWVTAIFSQANHISIDFDNYIKTIPDTLTPMLMAELLKGIDIIVKEDYQSEQINFAILKKENNSEIVIIKQTDQSSEIIMKDGKSITLDDKIKSSILYTFRLIKKVDIFDFSDKAIAENFGFKWFIKEMLKYKKLWHSVIIWSLLIQCVSFALPLMTQTVIDKVIVNQAQMTLIAMMIGVFIFNLFNTGFNWARQQMILFVGNKIDNTLANEVVTHLFRLPRDYFEKRSTGTTISRIHAIESIREFLAGTFITLILDLPFVLIFLGVMFYYSIILTSVTLFFVALMLTLSIVVAPVIRAKAMQQAQMAGKNQAFLTEYVAGVDTVKSLQMENVLFHQYRNNFSEYLEKSKSVRSLSINYNTAMTWLEQTLSLVILGLGAYLSMMGEGFSIGMLIAFQMFSGRVTQPLLRIASMWQEFQQTQIAMLRLKDVMDNPMENYSLKENVLLDKGGSIKLKGLGFKYPNSSYLYKNLNIEIKSGQLVVIQGESGCGKSTLTKLLQGFYTNYEGTIEINGVDIKKLSVLKLRSIMGVVPQETVLFSGTIMENFKLVKPSVTLEEVSQVCKMAGIHDVIQDLPNGYETEIGERGTGLSGGQRQRIAIARALLCKPSILIFDEAVSSLDPETSKIIGETINFLKGKVTIIFITHIDLPNIVADSHIRMKKLKD